MELIHRIGVIYGSICLSTTEGKQWLNRAVSALLSSVSNSNGLPAETLWSLSYSQRQSLRSDDGEEEPDISGQSIIFSDPSTDLVFDDSILREVRKAWQVVTGKTNGFMEFEDREVGEYEDDCE